MSLRLVAAGVAPVWRDASGSEVDDRVTEALPGEPVVTTGNERAGRVEVRLPGQSSSLDAGGYPGWVDAVLLGGTVTAPPAVGVPAATFAGARPDADAVDLARTLLGTPYLWGGLTGGGIDCSGLVHLVCRALGVLVPRDARDQAAALPPVPADGVRRGDLCFFARPPSPVHHVAWVVEPGVILHASDRDGGVVEASLEASGRSGELSGAARPWPGLR